MSSFDSRVSIPSFGSRPRHCIECTPLNIALIVSRVIFSRPHTFDQSFSTLFTYWLSKINLLYMYIQSIAVSDCLFDREFGVSFRAKCSCSYCWPANRGLFTSQLLPKAKLARNCMLASPIYLQSNIILHSPRINHPGQETFNYRKGDNVRNT